jgi:hypothetical protein
MNDRDELAALLTETGELHHRTFAASNGVDPEWPAWYASMNRRRFRIRHLQTQLAEIREKLCWLESELTGFDKGKELVLMEAIEELRSLHREAWSPFPVFGCRMWAIDADGFHDMRLKYSSPTMHAQCLTTGENDNVPHTDGRYGQPPCGIYATKSVEDLLSEGLPRGGAAVGMVEISGKVVEHVRGTDPSGRRYEPS